MLLNRRTQNCLWQNRSQAELQEDRALYRDSLKVLLEAYKIPQAVIDKTLKYVKVRIERSELEKKAD